MTKSLLRLRLLSGAIRLPLFATRGCGSRPGNGSPLSYLFSGGEMGAPRVQVVQIPKPDADFSDKQKPTTCRSFCVQGKIESLLSAGKREPVRSIMKI